MKNPAKDMLSDWMRPIEVTANTAANANREKAIKKICSIKDKSVWLNIIRTALGLPSSLKDTDFIQYFKKQDDNVPLENNEYLAKVLANVTICFKLESGDSDFNHWLALAIVNANTIGLTKPEPHIPILGFAQEILNAGGEASRNVDFKKLRENVIALQEEAEEDEQEDEEKEEGEDEEEDDPLNEVVVDLYNTNIRLLEEINILWWLFTGYSKMSNCSFQKIDQRAAPLVAAVELNSMMQVPRIFPNANQFFHKIIGDTKKNETTVFDAVNALEKPIKKLLIQSLKSQPNEFTPVAKAVVHAEGHPDGDDWSGSFKKQFHSDVKKTINPIALAEQLSRELLFLGLTVE